MDKCNQTLSPKRNANSSVKSDDVLESQKLKKIYHQIKIHRKKVEVEAHMIKRQKDILKHTEEKLRSKNIRETYSEKRRRQIKEISETTKELLESKKLYQRVESETRKQEFSMNKENLKKLIEVKRICYLSSVKVKVNEFKKEKDKLKEDFKVNQTKELMNKSLNIDKQRQRYKEMILNKSSTSFKSQIKLIQHLQDRIDYEQNLTSKYSEIIGANEEVKSSLIETFADNKFIDKKLDEKSASKVHITKKFAEQDSDFDRGVINGTTILKKSSIADLKSAKPSIAFNPCLNKRKSSISNGA